ncbi:MAG: glycoside hydrolase family 43 protein [Chloroflexota bacterium]|nr:glycoside hydrolase family 43 protein [Chloroflexota bacterium]
MMIYTNPVYPHNFADPFVLRHEEMYYAYGTAQTEDARVLPVLSSPDLSRWDWHGGALVPPTGAVEFWAPEVAFAEGVFYMYYSARGIDGRDHQLRVARSASPLGPFEDVGQVLNENEPFSIDAHPFRAADGQWYLFFAKDFLERDEQHHVGTGIVVDRLMDMLTLAGDPRLVVRPHADWHLFRLQRTMYGNIYDWYTVEGPSVLQHDGLYYCFYSGGAWEKENYGVSYVVAEHPLGPWQQVQTQVLRSLPPDVIGPGHNSFAVAPDGRQMMVYHAWDAARTGRYMRIDALLWQDGVPQVTPTFGTTVVVA